MEPLLNGPISRGISRRLRTPALLASIALLAPIAFYPDALFGQAVSGDLVGVVSDQTGAAIPKASVTVVNDATGVRSAATADNAGTYRFANLTIGVYTLSASAPGFASGTLKNVQVQLNNVVTQNLTLSVGTTGTTVEVTEAPVALDTTTAQLQSTYDVRQIEDQPTAGFSRTAGIQANVQSAAIWNVSLFSAGVASNGGVGQGTGPTIAGQRPEDNTFFLDGVANINHLSTGPLAVISNEAVAELSVLQNQFSAEFGGASGGVFNAIVKTGTNQIRGSIYEYFQNRNLNADDASYWTQGLKSFPRYDNNRLGATIGGAIIKNKLFYFGNFEYNPIGQASVPNAPIYAPTSAGYSLLAGIPQVSKNNLGVLQKYAGTAPTADQGTLPVGGLSIPIGSISTVGQNYDNNYNAVVSLDYNIRDSDQLRGRWIYNRITGIDNQPVLPAFYVAAPNNSYFYSLSEFHTFSPTLQNEFRGSFSRNDQQTPAAPFTFPGLNVFPDIDIDPLQIQIGGGSTEPSGSIQNLLQLQDNVIKVAGKHTIKAGYSFTDVILTNYFIQRVRGEYEYSNLQQYLYDLTPDVLGERSAGPSAYPTGFLQNAAFVNDDFRIRPNLTLNLGVRYEYVTMPIASRAQVYSAAANVPGGLTFNQPHFSPNDWSPRVGFAYSPGGSSSGWVVRGGFSRSFDLTYGNLTSNAAPAFFQTTQDVNLSSNAPNFLANGALAGISPGLPTDPLAARSIIGSYIFSDKRPYGLTWTLGVQRLLGKDYTLEARYTGTKGVHLWNQTRLNVVPQVNSSNYLPTFFSMPSASALAGLSKTFAQVSSYVLPGGTAALPFDQYAALGFTNNLVSFAPQGYSSYNGLAIQVTKRYSNGFSYIAAYTWSHLLDDATATGFSTYLSPRRAQDFQNLRSEWASSALDRRQRFSFAPIYDWRPFKNGSWMMKNVAGNWTFSGSYTYQSPEYATAQSGVDSNLNNDSVGDRTIINPSGQANLGTDVYPINAQGQVSGTAGNPGPGTVAYVAKNPNARYVVAGVGALANAGRNTVPLKPTDNVDLSISKRFNLTERAHFEIAGQFFNIFNHAQYTGGYLTDVAGSAQINSRSDLIPSSPLFGRFDQFYSSNSRFGQIMARIVF